MSRTLLDIVEERKSLHFNIKGSAHSALRIACFKHKITMQDFFDEVSQLVEAEAPFILSIMQDIAERKKNKKIQSLSETDAESLYSIIEKEIADGDI